MKWSRSNIRHKAGLALLALAVQLALSFGHNHAFAAQVPTVESATAPSLSAGLNAAAAQATQSPGKRASGQQPAGRCAICTVVAMAGTALFATPPLLMLPEAVEFLYRTTDAEFVHLKSTGAAFRPRTPPAS